MGVKLKDLSIEQRLRRLEDIEEITTLIARYAHCANVIDGPGNLAGFAALFAEDAVWDVGLGVCRGPAEIEERMKGLTTQWKTVMHYILNPLLSWEGDSASGTLMGLFPFVAPNGVQPVWVANMYENRFVRTADGWRIQRVRGTTLIQPPEYNEGYADKISAPAA